VTDTTTPRHIAARQWRETRQISRKQLAEMSGFSASSIQDYETGYRRGHRAETIPETAWRRYALALAALDGDPPVPF
jgi:predicted transcriptional regulator